MIELVSIAEFIGQLSEESKTIIRNESIEPLEKSIEMMFPNAEKGIPLIIAHKMNHNLGYIQVRLKQANLLKY